jgi:hypothetical protein
VDVTKPAVQKVLDDVTQEQLELWIHVAVEEHCASEEAKQLKREKQQQQQQQKRRKERAPVATRSVAEALEGSAEPISDEAPELDTIEAAVDMEARKPRRRNDRKKKPPPPQQQQHGHGKEDEARAPPPSVLETLNSACSTETPRQPIMMDAADLEASLLVSSSAHPSPRVDRPRGERRRQPSGKARTGHPRKPAAENSDSALPLTDATGSPRPRGQERPTDQPPRGRIGRGGGRGGFRSTGRGAPRAQYVPKRTPAAE